MIPAIMHLPLISVLLLSLFSPLECSKKLDLSPFPSINLSLDYGRIIVMEPPAAVLRPNSPQDISLLLKSISSDKTTVAPRGAGHSTYGQAQAPGGIVVDMQSLPSSLLVGTSNGTFFVDAGGGVLWVDVLIETLKNGLTPISWTDYLYLTVGGTLSVGGISGQMYKHGPQISNVLEMDVVTGKGEHVTCSRLENSDLFYGVLGGLGQFGIITRARIILETAPNMAKRVTIAYDDFDWFTADQELLITMGEVDYLEGFVNLNSSSNHLINVYYTIEFTVYYDDADDIGKRLERILSGLSFAPAAVQSVDVSYFDFINRVRSEELKLRRLGLWEVPHPWLILFVPKAQKRRFKDLLLETISGTFTNGPILFYPTFRDKWDSKMSTVLPKDEGKDGIMYVVSVLQAADPSCVRGSPCLETLLSRNRRIIEIATLTQGGGGGGDIGAKQYLPYLEDEKEWMLHFGEGWERFKQLKSRFDPLNVLTPGQRIFKRKSNVEVGS